MSGQPIRPDSNAEGGPAHGANDAPVPSTAPEGGADRLAELARSLKGKALDAGQMAKGFAEEQVVELKERGPYFQAKLAIGAAFVVVSVLTLLLVPSSEPSFVLKQRWLSFGLSFKTVLEIENRDGGNLEDVIVEVNGRAVEFDGKEVPGTWRSKKMAIDEKSTVSLMREHLYDNDNNQPPFAVKIDHVKILDGDNVVLDLPAPTAEQR